MGQKTAAFLKTQNRDFHNVIDSALNLQDGGTVAGATTFSGATNFSAGMTSNYLDFATGNASNLQGTVVEINDGNFVSVGGNAAAILAATLNAGALNTCAFDGGAAGAVYLPICAADTHVAVHMIGDDDGGNSLTFFARGAVGAGTDVVFAKQTITFNGKGGIGVITSGTPATPTAIKLIYTGTASATNALHTGSIVHFYAPIANRWVVRIDSIAEGTGVTGTLTTATS